MSSPARRTANTPDGSRLAPAVAPRCHSGHLKGGGSSQSKARERNRRSRSPKYRRLTTRSQRTVFGEVAQLYDRVRPGYPEALVEDVLEFVGHPKPRIVEVGAGTGKATSLFAPHSHRLVAVEPDAEMVSVAARKLAKSPNVSFEVMTFEEWDPQSTFELLLSGQAWHWVDQQTRYLKAHQILVHDGALAVFWYRPTWDCEPIRERLTNVYDLYAPDLKSYSLPGLMCPKAGEHRGSRDEIEASHLFAEVETRTYGSLITYSTEDYTDLLCTQSNHRMLPEATRRNLLEAVSHVLDHAGGSIDISYSTRLYMARRKP